MLQSIDRRVCSLSKFMLLIPTSSPRTIPCYEKLHEPCVGEQHLVTSSTITKSQPSVRDESTMESNPALQSYSYIAPKPRHGLFLLSTKSSNCSQPNLDAMGGITTPTPTTKSQHENAHGEYEPQSSSSTKRRQHKKKKMIEQIDLVRESVVELLNLYEVKVFPFKETQEKRHILECPQNLYKCAIDIRPPQDPNVGNKAIILVPYLRRNSTPPGEWSPTNTNC